VRPAVLAALFAAAVLVVPTVSTADSSVPIVEGPIPGAVPGRVSGAE
jgi:hypothetical protein